MGFFDEVLNAIGKVVNVVMYAAGTITGIALAGTVEFIQVACEKFGEFRSKNRSTNLKLANKPIHGQTRLLNGEIGELERKKARDRSLGRDGHQRLTDSEHVRYKLWNMEFNVYFHAVAINVTHSVMCYI